MVLNNCFLTFFNHLTRNDLSGINHSWTKSTPAKFSNTYEVSGLTMPSKCFPSEDQVPQIKVPYILLNSNSTGFQIQK